MIEILIKRLSKNISLPKYETEGSSGMDLAANIEKEIRIDPGKSAIYRQVLLSLFLKVMKYKLDPGQV